MDEPISFDPSQFEPSLDELMNYLGKHGAMLVPKNLGGSSSAKNWFSNNQGNYQNEYADEVKRYLYTLQMTDIIPLTWEYEFIVGPQEKHQVNALGKDGWELCAVVPRPTGELWVFKRPLVS